MKTTNARNIFGKFRFDRKSAKRGNSTLTWKRRTAWDRWCQADVKVSSIKGLCPQISKAKLKQLPEFAWYSRRAVISEESRDVHVFTSKWSFLFWLICDRTWICQKYSARWLCSFWYEVFNIPSALAFNYNLTSPSALFCASQIALTSRCHPQGEFEKQSSTAGESP